MIEIEGLGKKYKIGANREKYLTIRDQIAKTAKSVFRRFAAKHSHTPVTEDFWALKDVSFSVKQGGVVGIIGRNGAGKSTLLKILSQITPPTEGRITMRGRVASLLEVGTGFHAELTGRENVYLNGAILGMTRAEIRRKFDEIVDFAEVEKFLDTPVKHYSSGMYVRLAFAVAAHLDQEILIVDEVLAVGDAAFQQKCLGKMKSVARTEGRTILFVSHNIVALKQLCQEGVWIRNGCIRQIGLINDVAQAYMSDVSAVARTGGLFVDRGKGDGRVFLVSYRVTDAGGKESPPPGTREDLLIFIKLRVRETIGQPAFGISINNESGTLMTSINTVEQGSLQPPLPAGEGIVCVRINNVSFLPGNYTASFWVMNPQGHIYVMSENAISFEIAQVPLYGTRHLDYRWGCVYSDIHFTKCDPKNIQME